MHVTEEEGIGTLSVTAEYDASTLVNANGLPTTDPFGGISVGCPSSLSTEVADTLLAAAANGGNCLRGRSMNNEAFAVFHTALARRFVLTCRKEMKVPSGVVWAEVDRFSLADPLRPVTLLINLDWWLLNTDRKRTIFHEILHGALSSRHDPELNGMQTGNFNSYKELDRVSACESLCYDPQPTKCACAACRGAKSCRSCGNLAACASGQNRVFCTCATKPKWYSTATQCAAECPSGLGCAFAGCRVDGNACK